MRSVILKFKNMKIKTQLLITYSLLTVMMISIIYIISAAKIISVLKMQASREISNSTLQIKENIQNMLDYYETSTDYIVFNQTFLNDISHMKDNSITAFDRTKEATEILMHLKNIDSSITRISVYLFKDTVLFDGKTFIKYSENNELPNIQTNISWSGRHLNSRNVSVINQYRVIHDYPLTSRKIGILSVEIPENRVYEYIKNESIDNSIVIYTDKGEVVTASRSTPLIAADSHLLQVISEHLNGQTEIEINGEETMLFYATAENGWKIVYFIPVSRFMADTNEINRHVTIVILLSLVVFMTVTFITLSMMTKRLSKFTRAVHKVGEGQYDFRLDISGGDEIGQLAGTFNKMIEKLNVLFNDVYVAQIKMKESEIQALQAQVHPHFLYNVLSSIGYAALKRNAPEVRNMLNDLAEFYRFTLSKGNSLVTLDEEITHVKTYMSIQNLRFGSIISVEYEIADDLHEYKVMKLIIQPFVENCIHHALRDSETPLHIKIVVRKDDEFSYIEISDDGVGISGEKTDQINNKIQSGVEEKSYGIQNVHNRIRLLFGDKYGVTISSVTGIGTCAVIRMPKPC